MEEHYIKDVGKITYEYGVNLEEHKTVIEKQQKRIAELEQELAELKSKYEDCENERLQNRMDYLTMKNKWLNSEKKLAELKEKAIVPKFNKGDVVYALFTDAMVVRCQVDAFDYYTNSYLLFPNEDIGNEWIEASNVFKNKVEALAKIKK